MTAKFVLLALATALLTVMSVMAVADHGYLGIFTFHLQATAGMQVLLDLVIVCTLAILWMWQDAQRQGRNPWPFIILTLVGGSFGPLLYLLTGLRQGRASDAAPA